MFSFLCLPSVLLALSCTGHNVGLLCADISQSVHMKPGGTLNVANPTLSRFDETAGFWKWLSDVCVYLQIYMFAALADYPSGRSARQRHDSAANFQWAAFENDELLQFTELILEL